MCFALNLVLTKKQGFGKCNFIECNSIEHINWFSTIFIFHFANYFFVMTAMRMKMRIRMEMRMSMKMKMRMNNYKNNFYDFDCYNWSLIKNISCIKFGTHKETKIW